MTAVVRPVSIQNLLTQSQLAPSNGFEVILNEEGHHMANPCSALYCAKSSAVYVSKIQAWNGLVRLREILFSPMPLMISLKRGVHWVQEIVLTASTHSHQYPY